MNICIHNLFSECPKGLFGSYCTKSCNCSNNAPCDHITGECQCPDGYIGETCQTSCEKG